MASMPITLITGPANSGKARVVMDAVRGHLAHGEEPLLVVPTRADTEHYRRELAGDGSLMGARVERFEGLIGEAVRRAGVGEPLLEGLAREQLLGAIVRAHGSSQPPREQPPGDRRSGDGPTADAPAPGLVRALAACVAELQVRRVSPARLSQALAAWEAASAAAGSAMRLGDLFAEYHRALSRLGRLDREQRAVRALDVLRGRPALWGDTPVLFYGFDDLTRLQIDAIETLGAVVGARVTVSLTYEHGRTAFSGRAATFLALEPLAAEHRELGARSEHYAPASRGALSHLERSLFEPDPTRVEPEGVRLLEGGGERAELELVAREIAALLQRGMAPGEIAVVLRAGEETMELLEEVFAAANIPYALQRGRPFANTSLGAALIGLLRCAGAEGQAGDLLAWLRAPGLLEHAELADRLELRVRRSGALSAAQARAMWEERNWPLTAIDRLSEAAERSPQELIERAGRELQWLFDAPRRGMASVLGRDELDDAQALAAGQRALGELRELARAARGEAPRDADELARLLQGVELLSGERPTPDSVAVLDPLAVRARRVRALFLCRMQEGVFPAPARPQPFLAEEERRRLAETSGLRLGEFQDALASERYLLYAVVSRPEELLVLSWHAADDDGEAVARSLFVDDLCDLFEESLGEQRIRRPLGAVGWGQALRLAPGPASRAAFAGLQRPDLLLEAPGEAGRRRPWSASSLELWIRCPVLWFVERVLRPHGLDPDSEPMVRGALAHAALKDVLEGLRRETGTARLTRASLALARELLGRALQENEGAFPLSAAPERRPGLRRRLQSDLERYLEHAAGLDSPLEPIHFELGFGFEAEEGGDAEAEEGADAEAEEGAEVEVPASGLPALDLGGGVLLRGRIDRVDVDAGGEAVVYDYKTGRVLPAAKWERKGNIQLALYMRAVESLLELRAVAGLYQPLRGRDLRARGVLDADASVRLDCVASDRLERFEVRELLDWAAATAREAAAQAARGELAPRPETCAFKGGCSYPSICRCER
jgi:RecB family exonuclease